MKVRTFRVAVYGTLMEGERNAYWAEDALDRTPCWLSGRLYDTGWGFPAFVPDAEGGPVRAELLTVCEETLARMDRLEGFPRLYRRDGVTVTLDDGNRVDAMVYVMNSLPSRARALPSGDWREHRKNIKLTK